MDTIWIQSDRWQLLGLGHKAEIIDSAVQAAYQGANLADLLMLESDVFIKSYGLGSLATPSFRGGGASHTALIWNGFNLQSPMNGQRDLSLPMMSQQDQIRIQSGGSAALFGSGAVGGAIHLNQHPDFNHGLSVAATQHAGSFGQLSSNLSASYGNSGFSSNSSVFHRQAKNDFLLPNGLNRQPNAALSQQGVQQHFAFIPNAHQMIQVWGNWQQSFREIPPPLTSHSSEATQEDESLWLAAAWTRVWHSSTLNMRSGWFRDVLLFRDPSASIDALSQSQTFIQEAEFQHRISRNHSINLGVNLTQQLATADGYEGQAFTQTRPAILISHILSQKGKPYILTSSLRMEMNGTTLLPPTPSVSWAQWILPGLKLRSQVGRTYRLPTFNDLYWSPGGNPDLLPESGWNGDAGIEYHQTLGTGKLKAELTGYQQLIDNWILWKPRASFWSPENVRTVWSRGLESSLNIRQQLFGLQSSLSTAYTFTQATITEVASARNRSLNQQLIYTPLHQSRIRFRIEGSSWYAMYSHAFIGKVFTTSDNSRFLPGYGLGAIAAGYTTTLKTVTIRTSLRLDNVWNFSYQVIENRAMPGRSGSLSLTIQYHSPTHN